MLHPDYSAPSLQAVKARLGSTDETNSSHQSSELNWLQAEKTSSQLYRAEEEGHYQGRQREPTLCESICLEWNSPWKERVSWLVAMGGGPGHEVLHRWGNDGEGRCGDPIRQLQVLFGPPPMGQWRRERAAIPSTGRWCRSGPITASRTCFHRGWMRRDLVCKRKCASLISGRRMINSHKNNIEYNN
jgi:hypothetical protein